MFFMSDSDDNQSLPSCEGSGLKRLRSLFCSFFSLSPFLRREWIETSSERGIKAVGDCLPSCEGSGLKHPLPVGSVLQVLSPFLRREWIETQHLSTKSEAEESPFLRREWIETYSLFYYCYVCWSPFLRREWIETPYADYINMLETVSLLAKGVD